jgi:hypothetical protein
MYINMGKIINIALVYEQVEENDTNKNMYHAAILSKATVKDFLSDVQGNRISDVEFCRRYLQIVENYNLFNSLYRQ